MRSLPALLVCLAALLAACGPESSDLKGRWTHVADPTRFIEFSQGEPASAFSGVFKGVLEGGAGEVSGTYSLDINGLALKYTKVDVGPMFTKTTEMSETFRISLEKGRLKLRQNDRKDEYSR
ncbi:MAG: hypothetical protein AAB320_02315 [Elusimicrobiota bacterium]